MMVEESGDRGDMQQPSVVRVACPNGHVLKVSNELAGRKAKCPKCNSVFKITVITTDDDSTERSSSLSRDQLLAIAKEKKQILAERSQQDWWSFISILAGFVLALLNSLVNFPLLALAAVILLILGFGLSAVRKGHSISWGFTFLLCGVGTAKIYDLEDRKFARLREINESLDPVLPKKAVQKEKADLLAERKSLQLSSFLLGIPGLVLIFSCSFWLLPRIQQISDSVVAQELHRSALVGIIGIYYLISIPATILICSGVACGARYKGRSSLWGTLAPFCLIGLIITYFITDLHFLTCESG